MSLPVYVLGFGDTYTQFFNAIAATVNNSSYGALIKLAVLLGGCWTLVMSSIKQQHVLNIKWLVGYVVIMSAILTPRVTLQIIDTTNAGASNAVANVPLGLGVLASFTSRIGVGLAQLVDDTFHTPNELDYTQSGMLMGAKLMLTSSQFQVTGGNFQQNLQSFMHQCVFYDVLLHKYSLQALADSPNIWQFVTNQASPARAFIYNKKVTTCSQGAQYLSNDWKTAIDNAAHRYSSLLYPNNTNNTDNTNAKTQLLSLLPTTYQYLAGLSSDASQLMQQNMMIQAIRDGLGEWSSTINATSALQSIAFSKAQAQKREAYSLLYRMAIYWLPLMKVVLELVLYGMFILVVFLLFFPIGIQVAKHYVMAMLWIQFWAPLFAFVNFIFNLSAEKMVKAATLLPNGVHVVSLSTFSGMDQMLLDLGKTAGFMAMAVPFLSSGIFFGLMRTFTSLSQLLGGSAQSMSFNAAGEAVTGNVSLGNTSIDTHSAHNMNANHLNTNANVSSGMMSYQLQGGSQASIAPSGKMVFNSHGGISTVPVRINLAESLSHSFSSMADKAYSTAMRDSHSASESYSQGLRELYELGNTESHHESSGSSHSLSDSGSFSTAARDVHQLVDRFAKENHISHTTASRVLSAKYGEFHAGGNWNLKDQLAGKVWDWASGVNLSGGASGGARIDKSHSDDTQHSALLNKAEAFSKEHSFNQTVDRAVRASHEQQYRTGSDHTNRLTNSMSSHFEKGNRYSHDAMSSFEHAQSYREQSSNVQSQSMSMDTQASQEFVNWMMQQPAPGGRGRMDAQTVEYIMTHDPAQREAYAKQFVQTQQSAYIQQFQQHSLSNNIQSTYESNQSTIGNHVIKKAQDNQKTITEAAQKTNTGELLSDIEPVVTADIKTASLETSNAVDRTGSRIEDQVKRGKP